MSISRYRFLALGLVIALLAGTAVAAGTGALPGKLGDLVGQRQGSQSGAGSTAAAASGAGAPSASGATSAGGGAAAGGAGGATSAGGAGSLVAGVAGVVA